MANALTKEMHFLADIKGVRGGLHYLRTKNGQELDFMVSLDEVATHLIEVKMSDSSPAKGFRYFSALFPEAKMLQVVKNIARDASFPNGLMVKSLVPWLAELSLQQD